MIVQLKCVRMRITRRGRFELSMSLVVEDIVIVCKFEHNIAASGEVTHKGARQHGEPFKRLAASPRRVSLGSLRLGAT